nr:unnamed protein product [Callosobruchus chinensis]
MKVIALISILSVSFCSAANILAVVPSPAFSHQSTFWPVWRELSLRGHQVTLLTTDPMGNRSLTNLTEHNFHHVYKHKEEFSSLIDTASLPVLIQALAKLVADTLTTFFESEVVQDLLKNNATKKYDLVIAEDLFPEFLVFGDVYKCPTILIHSTDTLPAIHKAMGNSIHPVVYSEKYYACQGSLKATFLDRLGSTLHYAFISLVRNFYTNPMRHTVFKKYMGSNVPTIDELSREADLLLLNIHPVLHGVKLLGQNTITFAGGVHMREPKPLPKNIKSFLDKANNGVIYFSLGTSVSSSQLNEVKKKTIIDTFRQLPYSIIWKYEQDDLTDIPDNVLIVKWAPQQDILRHPNVKLFITQGGQQSIEEALLNGVPMIVLPFGVDQIPNAKKIDCEGLGKYVNHKPTLSKEQFKSAIEEIINNQSKYRERVKGFAKLLLDEPMPGIEKALWWIEYIIRHKGAKHLRNPIVDIPMYQYLMLDVIATVFVVLLSIIAIVYLLFKTIKCFFGSKKKKSVSVNKKKK